MKGEAMEIAGIKEVMGILRMREEVRETIRESLLLTDDLLQISKLPEA
ncbi:hypothetical protein T08_311 [Trichinella sp. T8]|nr:hypothetical protein T08_311 [Trichinella sp. T8]